MSGACAPHLQCRNGIYHLRVRVPDAIRPLLGRSEVRRSLLTASFRQARLRAALYRARVMETFEMIYQTTMSPDQARILVQGCFRDLLDETERCGGYVPKTCRPELEVAEQVCMSDERISQLEDQLVRCDFDGPVVEQLKLTSACWGSDVDALEPTTRLNLLTGIARALIEQQRLFQLRTTDRLAPFIPVDQLFQVTANGRPLPIPSPTSSAPAKGPTVLEAVSRYLHAGKGRWRPKTYQARIWQMRFFREHVGDSTPLAAITAEHVRSFRDAVRTLHRSHGKRVGRSFSERQTESVEHRIADKTAMVIFEPLKAFFRWCRSEEGLLASNPAEDVRLVPVKVAKGKKSRRPFSADELGRLFAAPMFTGCRSVHRRYEPGDEVIKDAKYWIPILGLYTGARLGELVQLHVRDVHFVGPIAYLSINEDNASDVAAGDRKHVKSEAGVRLVPLHSDVIALGFADFVRAKAKLKGKSRVRLFPEFPYGSDGQASTVFSKFFARFMDSVGLTDPALVFHSLRHNAEDALRNALIPQYVIDRIIGHSNQSVSAGYGDGVSLDVMADAVARMKLKYRLVDE